MNLSHSLSSSSGPVVKVGQFIELTTFVLVWNGMLHAGMSAVWD